MLARDPTRRRMERAQWARGTLEHPRVGSEVMVAGASARTIPSGHRTIDGLNRRLGGGPRAMSAKAQAGRASLCAATPPRPRQDAMRLALRPDVTREGSFMKSED